MKIGKTLSLIREDAGFNQKQLAKKMGVSTSRVSRIESEIIPLNEKELDEFLNAVASSKAKDFSKYIKQRWSKVPKPSFFHPSMRSLQLAEMSLNKIDALKREIAPNSVFFRELEMHASTLKKEAEYLTSVDHTIACIGSIGVGKTTAICGFSSLKANDKPVLHTGGGRSTVCEVQIQQGPQYGILIEPLPEEELYKYIYDFCDYLLSKDTEKFLEAENFSLNVEIERCIRNMASLVVQRKKVDDEYQKIDQAMDLLDELRNNGDFSDDKLSDEFKMQVLLRLNIDSRRRTELWYAEGNDDDPKEWLRKNYFNINHGRHPDFVIPKRITVNIPEPILSHQELNLTIVDTKGVDETAKREDLEFHLNDDRALTICCSKFLDAPDETTRTLIERAIESGIKDRLEHELTVMVLPRSDEAVSVNTFDGVPIEDEKEGYQIREDEIMSDLMKYDLRGLPILFFNEKSDSPGAVKEFIIRRVSSIRNNHEKRIHDVAKTVKKVEENVNDAQAQAAYSEVLKTITAWINTHKEIRPIGKVHTKLTETILEKGTHASSVRASINRYGSWYNLDYYYQIGFGTRSETVGTIHEMISDMYSNIDTMLAREDLKPAHEFLYELKLYCKEEAENLFKRVQAIGKDIFREKLQRRDDLWSELQDRWGKGPGYKREISQKTDNWFNEEEQKKAHHMIQKNIAKSWSDLLSKIEDLARGIFE